MEAILRKTVIKKDEMRASIEDRKTYEYTLKPLKPKVRSKGYWTNLSDLDIPASAHDSLDVFTFVNPPRAILDNQIPPILDPSDKEYADPHDRMDKGPGYQNLMFEPTVRRGLNIPPRKPNVSGSIFHRRKTPCSPHGKQIQPDIILRDIHCRADIRELPAIINLVVPGTSDPYAYPTQSCGGSALGQVCQGNKTVTSRGHCLYRRVPVYDSEYYDARCYVTVGMQTHVEKWKGPPKASNITQTDRNIRDITGDWDRDEECPAKQNYYKILEVATRYFTKISVGRIRERGTQVDPWGVWNFRRDSKPVVDEITQAVLNQAAYELHEEEELGLLKTYANMYEFRDQRDKHIVQLTMAYNRKYDSEVKAHLLQAFENERDDKETEGMMMGQAYSRNFLLDLGLTALAGLRRDGFILDSWTLDAINALLVTSIQSQVDLKVQYDLVSRSVLDDILGDLC